MRVRIVGAAAVVLLALLGSASPGAGATDRLPPLCDGTWKQPKPIPNSDGYRLDDVAAVSTRDVWIVGSAPDGPLAIHWNGLAWRRVPTPSGAPGHSELLGIDARSSHDVWAVGNRYVPRLEQSFAYAIHWNGRKWQLAHLPRTTGYTSEGIAALPHHEVWVVARHATLHRTRSGWRRIPSDRSGGSKFWLTDVSAVSSSDVWAVGRAQTSGTSGYDGALVEHWNGSAWRVDRRASLSGGQWLAGVDAHSPSSVMAVGGFLGQALLRHGSGWTAMQTAEPPGLGGFSMNLEDVVWDSPTTAWAVGSADWGGIQSINYGYIDRWDGHSWSVSWVSKSTRSYLVAASSAGGMTWAVGATQRGVILERYC